MATIEVADALRLDTKCCRLLVDATDNIETTYGERATGRGKSNL